MEKLKTLLNNGIEYYYSAISFVNNNDFGDEVTIQIVESSAKLLLESILQCYSFHLSHNNLYDRLALIKNNKQVPDEVQNAVSQIQCQQKLGVIDKHKTIHSLRTIKQWTEVEVKNYLI